MTFDDDWQHGAGAFPVMRAKALAKRLESVCGSPIEIFFACTLATCIQEMGGEYAVVSSEDEKIGAVDFYIWPQRQIGRHRVDFLVGCKSEGKEAIIECDGREFHHATRAQIERDRLRDSELANDGHRVLRYPGQQIMGDCWTVAVDCLDNIAPDFQTRVMRFWMSVK